jgi:UDP-2-acetamido-2-deoxy-ribo-hexuluronate aminotransferase
LRVTNGRRDELQAFLQAHGVPSMIYYPVPLYEQGAYRDQAANGVTFLPVTDTLCKEVISLPMHSEMDEDTLAYICAQVKAFF